MGELEGKWRQDKGVGGCWGEGTAWPTLTPMCRGNCSLSGLRKLLQCFGASKAAPGPVWTWVAWMGIGGWETGGGPRDTSVSG